MRATIHLQRKWHEKPNQYEQQRMSYDVTKQTEESLLEIAKVLKEYSDRSNGEFNFWITGEPIETEDTFEFGEVLYGSKDNVFAENEGHTEDIHTLHSGESETDTQGPAE